MVRAFASGKNTPPSGRRRDPSFNHRPPRMLTYERICQQLNTALLPQDLQDSRQQCMLGFVQHVGELPDAQSIAHAGVRERFM